jgi:hypothetical protein
VNEEPNPELLNRQPKWFKPVLRWCMIVTAAFWIFAIIFILFSSNRGSITPEKLARIDAKSNLKQIGLALFEFDNDFGNFPNDDTTKDVNLAFPKNGHNLTGRSSNAAFLQLIATGITSSEYIFDARINGSIRPDEIIIPGEALKKSEVGFSYISDLSTSDDPLTPLVLTPLIPGTTKFDPKPFDGNAIILHIDQSVSIHIIAKDGHVYDKGINILSPKHPVWKGKTPDIRYPE